MCLGLLSCGSLTVLLFLSSPPYLFFFVTLDRHDVTEQTRELVKETSQEIKDLAKLDTSGVRLFVYNPVYKENEERKKIA